MPSFPTVRECASLATGVPVCVVVAGLSDKVAFPFALWAECSVGHGGFEQAHAVIVGRCKAGGSADRAGDVFDAAAVDALHVVVIVVAVLNLVESAADVGKVDAADNSRCGEIVDDAVDRGQCDTGKSGFGVFEESISGSVRMLVEDVQHGDSLCCDTQTRMAQAGCGVVWGVSGHAPQST